MIYMLLGIVFITHLFEVLHFSLGAERAPDEEVCL